MAIFGTDIKSLPAAAALQGNELVPVVQNGITSRTTISDIYSSPISNPQFLVLALDPSLQNERVLAVSGSGLTSSDSGAGGNYTISLAGTVKSIQDSSSTGIIVQDSSSSVVKRSLIAPAEGLNISNNDGVSGDPTFSLTGSLLSLQNLSGTGGVYRVGADTLTLRSITGTNNQISVTNGDGVSGSPTIAIASNAILPGNSGLTLPSGSNAQKAGGAGTIRFNNQTSTFEGYDGSSWNNFVPLIWGNITGNLSDQTDLQDALDEKLRDVAVDGVTIQGDGTEAAPLTTWARAYMLQSNNTALDGVPSSNSYFILGTPFFAPTGNMGQITQDSSTYTQFMLQNTRLSQTASVGFVVSNDQGTDSTNYGEFGINSTNYTGNGAINAPGAVFIDAPSGSVVLSSRGGGRSVRMNVSGLDTDDVVVNNTGLGIRTSSAGARLDITSTSIGSSPTIATGAILQNTTVAAAGAQQWSPGLYLRGNGWKTNATAGSQTVDGRIVVSPVQGAANPTGQMLLGTSINGAAFTNILTLDSSGTVTAVGSFGCNGSFNTSSTPTSSNFWVNSAATGAQTAASGLYFGTSGNISVRTAFNGTTAYTIPANNNYGAVIVGAMAATEAASGTHPILANMIIRPPAFTNGAGASTDIATLYIEGAPTGTATSTNGNLALLVDSGNIRVDDNSGLGVAPTATSFVSIGAGTTAKSSLNIASGAAPTAPVDGDIWFDGTNLKMRVGGVTKTFTLI